jgi:hypothetical protein
MEKTLFQKMYDKLVNMDRFFNTKDKWLLLYDRPAWVFNAARNNNKHDRDRFCSSSNEDARVFNITGYLLIGNPEGAVLPPESRGLFALFEELLTKQSLVCFEQKCSFSEAKELIRSALEYLGTNTNVDKARDVVRVNAFEALKAAFQGCHVRPVSWSTLSPAYYITYRYDAWDVKVLTTYIKPDTMYQDYDVREAHMDEEWEIL